MSAAVEYVSNRASAEVIADHLARCDADFVPPLSARVEIRDYAIKIASKAMRFEAWSGDTLVGLVAAYCDDRALLAYITSVSVLKEWTGKGIAVGLIGQCVAHAKASNMRQISLEVASDNALAVKLYENSGFLADNATAPFVGMNLYLKSRQEHDQ